MRSSASRSRLLLPLLGALWGCAACPAPASEGAPSVAQADASIARRAERMVARATAAEPPITALMRRVAADAGGELVGLDHRLKTQASTERKLRLDRQRTDLDDSLRYTMRVADAPPGAYRAAIRSSLAALEAAGHEVLRVKNYWPDGDSYSGVNCVLRTADGLSWELQLHTPRSLQVQTETRQMYEELRRADTPAARKRALFDTMAAAWRRVPIPTGVLEQGVLHARDELRRHTRP